jgi:hypothetical protein
MLDLDKSYLEETCLLGIRPQMLELVNAESTVTSASVTSQCSCASCLVSKGILTALCLRGRARLA